MNFFFKSLERLRTLRLAGLCLVASLPLLQGCEQSEAHVSLSYIQAEINQPEERRVRLFWQDRADAAADGWKRLQEWFKRHGAA